MNNLTKKELIKICNIMNKGHMDLMFWLKEKHPKIWEEYEKKLGFRLATLKEKDK